MRLAAALDFSVRTETGLRLRLVVEGAVEAGEEREADWCECRAAERHHQPLPQRPPAQEWFGSRADQRQQGKQWRDGARRQSQHELRVELLPQDQVVTIVEDASD